MEREVISFTPEKAEFKIGRYRVSLDGKTNICLVWDTADNRMMRKEHDCMLCTLWAILDAVEQIEQ